MKTIKWESKFVFQEGDQQIELIVNYRDRTYELKPPFNNHTGFVFKGMMPQKPMHEPGKISNAPDRPNPITNQAGVLALIAKALDFVDAEFKSVAPEASNRPVMDKVYIVQADSGIIHGCFKDNVAAQRFTGGAIHMRVVELTVFTDEKQ